MIITDMIKLSERGLVVIFKITLLCFLYNVAIRDLNKA